MRGNQPTSGARMALRAPVVALQGSLSAPLAIAAAAATLMIVTALVVGGARDSSTAIASGPLSEDCPSGAEIGPGGRTRDETGSRQRVLQVAGTWTDREQENFEKVLELFERTTDIEVSYAYVTRDTAWTLKKRAISKCPPDVALLPQPGLLREFARRGWLERLEQTTQARVRSNYTAWWRRLAEVRGEPYGVWLKAANKSMFWYNRALFEDADVETPRTWHELRQVASQLHKAGTTPFAVAGADASAWTLTDLFENVYLRTAGEDKYDALARGKIKWTDRTVRTALLTLSEVFGHGRWLAGGIRGASKTSYEQSVRKVLSEAPEAAMVFEGDFVGGLRRSRSEAANDTGTFAFPAIERADEAVVAGGDVAVQFKTQNRSARREFMHFLAGPAAAEVWASEGGFISPNKELDPRVYKDSRTERLANTLIKAKTIRFDLSDMQPPAFGAKAGQGMWRIFRRYLMDGPASVAVTMRRLQRASSAARSCERFVQGEC